MTPLPKRRHSTRRSGKREKSKLSIKLPKSNNCPKCHAPKLPHRICTKCGSYK